MTQHACLKVFEDMLLLILFKALTASKNIPFFGVVFSLLLDMKLRFADGL